MGTTQQAVRIRLNKRFGYEPTRIGYETTVGTEGLDTDINMHFLHTMIFAVLKVLTKIM